MPRSRSAISRPMLLITVATTAWPGQPPAFLQIDRRHQQHGVAVDDLAACDRRTARGRRRRRTRRRAARSDADHRSRDSPSRCVDPQSRLMLRPFGRDADRLDVEAERPEQRRRDRRRRAIGAVDHDRRPGERTRVIEDLRAGARRSAPTGPAGSIVTPAVGRHRPRRDRRPSSRPMLRAASVSFVPAPPRTP